MNVVLWVFQAALALLSFSGGAYKIFMFDELAKMQQTAALSRGTWSALGIFEIVCAILIVVPAATNRSTALVPLAAGALALENVGLAAIYARYSLEPAATNPLVWACAIALMAMFVAFGRYARARPA